MTNQYLEHFPTLLNDIINKYYNKHPKHQILTYFRLFYIFMVITKYIFKLKLSQNDSKDLFFEYFDKSVSYPEKNNIKMILENHYSFLYTTFFVENNIYFDVYFNNLIKYFFPFPYEFVLYSPFNYN